MSWNTLPPHVQLAALHALTGKQLEAWKLELAGDGTRLIAQRLNLSRTTVLDRLDNAHRRLTAAGITTDASGNYHLEAA